jgi:hypothetical protein
LNAATPSPRRTAASMIVWAGTSLVQFSSTMTASANSR